MPPVPATGQAAPTIGPAVPSVTRDPSLVGLDTGALRAVAGRWAAAAGGLSPMASRVASTSRNMVGLDWLGLGAMAYDLRAGGAINELGLAAGVAGQVSTVLQNLASQLDTALAQAARAESQAAQVAQGSQQLNTSFNSRQVAANACLVPTPAEQAQADALAQQAGQATQGMAAANQLARTAWQQAAAGFDDATAQAPSVRAAIAAARAYAIEQARKKSQGGSFWGGLGSLALGGIMWVGDGALGAADVVQGGLDPVTDGATVADTAGAIDETSAGLAELSGGSAASAAEVASAEEAAASSVTVDGAAMDSSVAADTGSGGLPWQQYEARYGGVQTPMETVYNGETIQVRLDAPVSDSGIVDFKNYDWSNPTYSKPFMQDVVKGDFQQQILKYQTINQDVTLQFSQQPPDWIIKAIEAVGGKYVVAP